MLPGSVRRTDYFLVAYAQFGRILVKGFLYLRC